ncbi:hypothetical protein KL86DPRO_70059 [uncultured delta proteobacterium]|uniref:Uncharacterized protein n=1 Tax=uncultured delta proteobacterium TaxID=34034 RepID=A0A212KGS7_9DELT|nr:hypothetical protein KL86DPRO_70059 [uncultured delta proteobacterium]
MAARALANFRLESGEVVQARQDQRQLRPVVDSLENGLGIDISILSIS